MEQRRLFLILCYFWTTTSSQLLSNNRQLDFGECCPCTKPTKIVNDQLPNTKEQVSNERCSSKCADLDADVASATSILAPALQALQPLIRSDIEKERRPLLNPEVDLASSVLETLQVVTDEEYQDALSRDMARSAIKTLEADLLQPMDETGNIISIILNPKQPGNDFEQIPEASHVQETRCIHSSLGSSSNYKINHLKSSSSQIPKQGINSNKKFNLHHRNVFDMDNGASNIKSTIHKQSKVYNLRSSLDNDKQKAKLFPTISLQEITDNIRSNLNATKKIIKNDPNLNLGSFIDYVKKTMQTNPVQNLFSSKKAPDNNDIVPASNTQIESQQIFLKNPLFNLKPKNLLKPLKLNNERYTNRLKNLLKLKDVEFIPKWHINKPFGRHIKGDKDSSLDASLQNGSINEEQKRCHESLETDITDVVESPSEIEIVKTTEISGSTESTNKWYNISNLVAENDNGINFSNITLVKSNTDLLNDSFRELNSMAKSEKKYHKTTDSESIEEISSETTADPCTPNMSVFETTTQVLNKLGHKKLDIINKFQTPLDNSLPLTEKNIIVDFKNVKNNYFNDKKENLEHNKNCEKTLNDRQYSHDSNNKEENITLSTLQEMSDYLLNLSNINELGLNIANQYNEGNNNDDDNIGSHTSLTNILAQADNICDKECNSLDFKNPKTKKYDSFDSELSTIAPTNLTASTKLEKKIDLEEDHSKEMCVQASEPIINHASIIKPDLKSVEKKISSRVTNLDNLVFKPYTARIHTPVFLNKNVLDVNKVTNSILGDYTRHDNSNTKRIGADSTIKRTRYNNVLPNLSGLDSTSLKSPPLNNLNQFSVTKDVSKKDGDIFKVFKGNQNYIWNVFNRAHQGANDKLQTLHTDLNNKLQSMNLNQFQLHKLDGSVKKLKNKLSNKTNIIYNKSNLNPFNILHDNLIRNKKQRNLQLDSKPMELFINKLSNNLKGLSKTQFSGENKIQGKTSKTSSIENFNAFGSTKTPRPKSMFSSEKVGIKDTTILPFKLKQPHYVQSAGDFNTPNYFQSRLAGQTSHKHTKDQPKNTIKKNLIRKPNYQDLISSLSSLEAGYFKKQHELRNQMSTPLLKFINAAQNEQTKLDKLKNNINNSLPEMRENIQSPTQNVEQFSISDKTLKENVNYRCKMVCHEDNVSFL